MPTPTGSPDTTAATDQATPSSQERALAAWHAYLEARSAAERQDDGQLQALQETSTGQALQFARQSANKDDNTDTRGSFEPDPAAEVKLADSGGSATIQDCVRGPEIVGADGKPIDRSQDRFAATATVQRRNGRWIVTKLPATQPNPTFGCAPQAIEQEVLATYRTWVDKLRKATTNPEDASLDDFAEVATGKNLEAIRTQLQQLRAQGERIIGAPAETSPRVVAVRNNDQAAFIVDCRTLQTEDHEGPRRIDASTGERLAGAEDGEQTQVEVRLERTPAGWRVAVTETKSGPCDAS